MSSPPPKPTKLFKITSVDFDEFEVVLELTQDQFVSLSQFIIGMSLSVHCVDSIRREFEK